MRFVIHHRTIVYRINRNENGIVYADGRKRCSVIAKLHDNLVVTIEVRIWRIGVGSVGIDNNGSVGWTAERRGIDHQVAIDVEISCIG